MPPGCACQQCRHLRLHGGSLLLHGRNAFHLIRESVVPHCPTAERQPLSMCFYVVYDVKVRDAALLFLQQRYGVRQFLRSHSILFCIHLQVVVVAELKRPQHSNLYMPRPSGCSRTHDRVQNNSNTYPGHCRRKRDLRLGPSVCDLPTSYISYLMHERAVPPP